MVQIKIATWKRDRIIFTLFSLFSPSPSFYVTLVSDSKDPSLTPIQGPIFIKNGSVPVVPLFSYPTMNNGTFIRIPVSISRHLATVRGKSLSSGWLMLISFVKFLKSHVLSVARLLGLLQTARSIYFYHVWSLLEFLCTNFNTRTTLIQYPSAINLMEKKVRIKTIEGLIFFSFCFCLILLS